ncbi:MAG: phenylpyruvate tautomerase MIF-related protein [Gammaproteobacteria bacterium]|jgi:phenylpyruvate tautomerase PptA (4-oxalocrotonate tautomerase family)
MPLLKIETNQSVAAEDRSQLIAKASQQVASMLGKPERYVMVSLQVNPAMLFGGSDAPLAYLELKSIGLPEARTAELSQGLAELMKAELDLPADRVYVEFADAPRSMWGWNSGTF